jgi:hypothetical protein
LCLYTLLKREYENEHSQPFREQAKLNPMKPISINTVHEHMTTTLPDVVATAGWGETSYFFNPGLQFKRGTYFATIKEKDGDNDRASQLDRPGIWRLNIGIRKATFLSIFNAVPGRPAKGRAIEGQWDFTATDLIAPHPIYGWMGWIAVVSPSETTWQSCIPLIKDAHGRATDAFEKRTKSLRSI